MEIDNLGEKELTPDNQDIVDKDYQSMSFEALIKEAKELIENFPIEKNISEFNIIRKIFLEKFNSFEESRKKIFLEEGGDELTYVSDNTLKNSFNSIYYQYKTLLNQYFKEQEQAKQANLEIRLSLIEELKSLYQQPMESTHEFFRKFHEVKNKWHETGKIPENKKADVYKTYYHHLDNTYQFIKMNKELQELDYAHNLEQRRAIINRAKELIDEPSVQKALNELQYLHKLWREQGEPVADEFKESTWQEFKEITQKVHERKSELFEKIKEEQQQNQIKKEAIIKELKNIAENSKDSHSFWQNNLDKIEKLREDFFIIGKTPSDKNNQLWNEFKDLLHTINSKKNLFYKQLKKTQQENLNKKLELIEIAKSNVDNEDWNVSLELFKKIQNDWKKIGHVPKKYSDKLWEEFKTVCNTFFDKYKKVNQKGNDDWKNNFIEKEKIINEIKNLPQDLSKDEIVGKINKFNIQWSSIGKVPRENMSINKEYDSLVRKVLNKLDFKPKELNQVKMNLKIESLKQNKDNRRLDDELKKLKKNIQDIEHEIVQMENNLSFFNSNPGSPLLKNTIDEINRKKQTLEDLKMNYHQLIIFDINQEEIDTSKDK